MIEVFRVMVAISLALGLTFTITLGPPWKTQNPSMAWLQAWLAWIAVSIDAVLLISSFGVEIGNWVVGLILLGQDIIFGWRLWLLLKIRRETQRMVPEDDDNDPMDD